MVWALHSSPAPGAAGGQALLAAAVQAQLTPMVFLQKQGDFTDHNSMG